MTCPSCTGTGQHDCTACGGVGTFRGGYSGRCHVCAGACRFTCSRCEGTGDVDEDDPAQQPRPAGVGFRSHFVGFNVRGGNER